MSTQTIIRGNSTEAAHAPDYAFRQHLRETPHFVADHKKYLPATELAKWEQFKNRPDTIEKGYSERPERDKIVKAILRKQAARYWSEDGMPLAKAGVTSALGYNFYDLRAPVLFAFPVNVPFRNMLPRIGKLNDGYGTAANWKATRNPGTAYAGVPEGQRAQVSTPDENNYIASYKELGDERAVTFTAEFAGEGFTDNLADEHLRGLYTLWLQEEGLMLMGNSGTAAGNNGFVFGTAPTPTTALVATNTAASAPFTAAFTTSNWVSVACVALTALGNPANTQYGYGLFPTVAAGLTPSYTYNAPGTGTTITVKGGMSAVSALSAPVQITSGNLTIKASVPTASLPLKGAYGYAWFLDTETSNTNSLANAKLAAITQFPYVYLSGTATGTQAANAAGLSTDNSAQATDFDGLLTYAASTAGAYYSDLQGASFTSLKNGRVQEIENALQYIWTNYQAGVSTIWGSADAVTYLDDAIRYSGTASSAYRFQYTRDDQNNLLGGFVVSAYQSRYAMNPNGANAIPIRIHPMLPPGTIYLDLAENPYPQSRAAFARGMFVQRDYYSIEWPLVSRQWTFGTYCHECLAMNFPWIPGLITGIGAFNFSQ